MPITLLSFTGKRQDKNNILLQWKIATEINNAGFEVEMAENGQDFQKVAFVEVKGNSNQIKNYELGIKNEKGCYFRLKQIEKDKNNVFAYSNVVFIDGFTQEIALFPNPVSEYLTLENLPQNAKIAIIDALGREKLNTSSAETTLKINVKNWQKGLYLVRIGKITKKIIVE